MLFCSMESRLSLSRSSESSAPRLLAAAVSRSASFARSFRPSVSFSRIAVLSSARRASTRSSAAVFSNSAARSCAAPALAFRVATIFAVSMVLLLCEIISPNAPSSNVTAAAQPSQYSTRGNRFDIFSNLRIVSIAAAASNAPSIQDEKVSHRAKSLENGVISNDILDARIAQQETAIKIYSLIFGIALAVILFLAIDEFRSRRRRRSHLNANGH